MQVNATSGVNEFNTYYSENQRGDIYIEDSFFDLYEPDDDRQIYMMMDTRLSLKIIMEVCASSVWQNYILHELNVISG